MRVAILAGGHGTRLADETAVRPKPLVEIGGQPILWHIMKHYSFYGFNEFVVALGYKGEMIKKYTVDYASLSGNLTVRFACGQVVHGESCAPDWTVHLVETGLNTATAGRIRRLAPFLGDQTFMLTWGDGVSDVDLCALLKYHRSHGRLATLTAVRPPARYGHLRLGEAGLVREFSEKPQTAEGWINGAFFVLEPGVLDYIDDDSTMFEGGPLQRLAAEGQLMAYQHTSFWQCMDTLREKHLLESLWQQGQAPWKIWPD
jgi:glucose-1-phosphate cytidylyltransferase